MSASLASLARTLAAAMAADRLSPAITVRCGPCHSRRGRFPSTSTSPGRCGNRCSARNMARSVATRMPQASISRADAWPRPDATHSDWITGTRAARRLADSFLLSVSPAFNSSSAAEPSSITAAANTGPNKQPRPTSSKPATSRPRGRESCAVIRLRPWRQPRSGDGDGEAHQAQLFPPRPQARAQPVR